MSDMSSDDSSSSDPDSITFATAMRNTSSSVNIRDHHRRMCAEGDGWSHAFGKLDRQEIIELFKKENWQKMGNAISQTATFKRLDLSDCELAEDAIPTLFGVERVYCCPINHLDLSENIKVGAAGVGAMLPFMKSRSSLKYINLRNTNLGVEGARLLSEALDHVRVEYLDLSMNNIGNEGMTYLLSATNCANLVELVIRRTELGRPGFEAIAQFLGRDDTAIKKLSCSCNNGEYAKLVVDSISNKSQLEDILLGRSSSNFFANTAGSMDSELWSDHSNGNSDYSSHDDSEGGSDDGCPLYPMMLAIQNLRKLICDTSSVESICQSNHQLKRIGGNMRKISQIDPTLGKALDINNESKNGVSIARRTRMKLRSFYFKGAYDVQPFIDMDIELMPYVLELLTRTEMFVETARKYYVVDSDNLDGIYHLIRNCHLPELFSFPSPHSQIKQLGEKNAALETDNSSLKETIDRLNKEIAELRISNSALPRKCIKTTDS